MSPQTIFPLPADSRQSVGRSQKNTSHRRKELHRRPQILFRPQSVFSRLRRSPIWKMMVLSGSWGTPAALFFLSKRLLIFFQDAQACQLLQQGWEAVCSSLLFCPIFCRVRLSSFVAFHIRQGIGQQPISSSKVSLADTWPANPRQLGDSGEVMQSISAHQRMAAHCR